MDEQVNAKKLDFQYTNLCTYYSCKCEQKKIDLEKHNMVCFSEVFGKVCGNAEYNIYVCKDPAILLNRRNNYCLLSQDDIIQWLECIREIVDMEYSITEDKALIDTAKQYDCYNIGVIVNNDNNMCHKFVLTTVRYLYEWPFNVVLKDVLRLVDIEQFKDETLINLHNMVFSSTYIGRHMGYGHSLTRCYAKLMSNDDIKESFKTNSWINDIFKTSFYANQMTSISKNYMLDYWESDEKFNKERLPIYIHNYDLLCKEREKNKTNNKKEEQK